MTGFKGVQNVNGRPKGTANKTTMETRDLFKTLLNNNIEQLQKDIDSLKPYERVKSVLELAKFVVPTLKAIEFDATLKVEENFKPLVLNFNKEQNQFIETILDSNNDTD